MLELLMFYKTRADNNNKYFRVLSCVINTIIRNYVCIDYLAFQPKELGEITVVSKEVSKHVDNSFNIILGIGIPYLLMNLMSCHGFLNNINSERMLGYTFPKGFTILGCNDNNMLELTNVLNQIVHAEET